MDSATQPIIAPSSTVSRQPWTSSAELVHGCLDTVDDGAIIGWVAESIHVHRSRQSKRTCRLSLNHRCHLESTGNINDSGEGEAADNVFSGWTIVAGTEGIQRVADAVNVVPEFSENAAPGLRTRQHVVRSQVKAVGDVSLHVQHHRVVTGCVV